MTWLTCCCGAAFQLSTVDRPHIQPDGDEPLVGGECPACGSTRYVPLARLSVSELAQLRCVEVLGSGAVVRAEDLRP
jgi:hypothetical protein